MENDILRSAKAEEQRLLAIIREHPIFQRLEAIRRVISLYESPVVPLRPDAPPPLAPEGRRGTRAGSQAEAIRQAAIAYLREKGERASSSELYAALSLKGVVVVGKKPNAVVASYLSHSDKFTAVRGEGYGLPEWDNPQNPESEAPNSSELSGAPRSNGTEPLRP
jgi:hypothetical protein